MLVYEHNCCDFTHISSVCAHKCVILHTYVVSHPKICDISQILGIAHEIAYFV